LMVSFDVVIFTGLFGLASYQIAPRILTSIEGDPLLIEDLEGRQAELRQELADISDKADERTRELIDRIERCDDISFRFRICFGSTCAAKSCRRCWRKRAFNSGPKWRQSKTKKSAAWL
jgi:hypothetical protein